MKDPSITNTWCETLVLRLSLQDGETAVSSTYPAAASQSQLPGTISSPEMYLPCEIVRTSPESLLQLHNISSAATVVLFTPVVLPARTFKSEIDMRDPFESLGRILSQYHKRIRHVPYVPSRGLTDIHVGFVRQAGAIFVVHCPPGEGHVGTSLCQQADFTEAVANLLEDFNDFDDDNIPVFLLQFVVNESRIDLPSCENVFQSDGYNIETAKEMAQLIFNRNAS